MKKTVRFYSKEEIKALGEIKVLPTKAEKAKALAEFCRKHDRPIAGAYYKLNYIKLPRRKLTTTHIDAATTVSNREIRFSVGNPWLDLVTMQLVFPITVPKK